MENELEENFESEVESRHVGELVMQHLRELDEVAYVRFASVYRQFKDVQDFVEELQRLALAVARRRASDRAASEAAFETFSPPKRLHRGGCTHC